MTEALFLADLHHPHVGDTVSLRGEEGRHAAAVRRIRVGETITISDGAGTGVRGPVTEATHVDIVVPGCPPEPDAIVAALRRVTRR